MLAGERAKGDEASPRSTIFRTAGLKLGVAGESPPQPSWRIRANRGQMAVKLPPKAVISGPPILWMQRHNGGTS